MVGQRKRNERRAIEPWSPRASFVRVKGSRSSPRFAPVSPCCYIALQSSNTLNEIGTASEFECAVLFTLQDGSVRATIASASLGEVARCRSLETRFRAPQIRRGAGLGSGERVKFAVEAEAKLRSALRERGLPEENRPFAHDQFQGKFAEAVAEHRRAKKGG